MVRPTLVLTLWCTGIPRRFFPRSGVVAGSGEIIDPHSIQKVGHGTVGHSMYRLAPDTVVVVLCTILARQKTVGFFRSAVPDCDNHVVGEELAAFGAG